MNAHARFGALLSAATLLVLAACRAGPNYHPPSLPAGADTPLVSLDPKLETAEAPTDAWWQLYRDHRLDELVQEALQVNRDLAAADANFAAARAALSGAESARYPSTELTAEATYGRDPITQEILEISGYPPQQMWLFADIFQVAYEVDLFGRVRRSIEEAGANADAVAAARDGVRVIVAANTGGEFNKDLRQLLFSHRPRSTPTTLFSGFVPYQRPQVERFFAASARALPALAD